MLSQGIYILPKGESEPRKAKPGDVAILCRGNADCESVATSLSQAGLSAAIARNGLLKTREIKIVLACLKFVLNKYDSLSIAEILFLIDNQSLEDIVEGRLVHLKTKEANISKERWAFENEYIIALDKLRTDSLELSGTEILNMVVEKLDLRRVISTWGNKIQRLDNLDALRKLALQYEENCNRMHTAASLGGLLIWLQQLYENKKDLQGAGKGEASVNVLTYHKSKGLEWPIVLCYNLENGLRDNLWGINVVRSSEKIDINKPLENSWLRYWINPYADQQKNTALLNKLDQSDLKAASICKALNEDIRLLYVGITRARDYLILPTQKNATKWLNRVCQDGDESLQILNASDPDSPWTWKDHIIPLDQGVYSFPKNIPITESEETKILFQEPRNVVKEHNAMFPDLDKLDYSSKITFTEQTNFSNPIKLQETLEDEVVNNFIFQLLKVRMNNENQDEKAKKSIESLINQAPEEIKVIQKELAKQIEALYSYIKDCFPYQKKYFDYSIRNMHQKKIFNSKIDLILLNGKSKIILFFLPNNLPKNKINNRLNAYINTIEKKEEFWTNDYKTFIIYPLSGSVKKVAFSNQLSFGH